MPASPIVIVRNDLLNVRTSPTGYIADTVCPVLPVPVKSGTRNQAQVTTSGTAQSGRSPGAAITATTSHSSNPVAFSCAEIISRQLIDESEVMLFGSRDEYEAVLAFTGTKHIRDAIETKVKNAYFTGTPTDVSASIYAGLHDAVLALRPYGRVRLFGSAAAFNTVRADATVIERMKQTGVPLSTIADVRSISPAQLAAILEADEVVQAVTDTVIWPVGGIGAQVIPDPNLDPMGFPQVGRRMVYTFRGFEGSPQSMTIEQMYDTSVRNEVIDFVVYDVAQLMNSTFNKYLTVA